MGIKQRLATRHRAAGLQRFTHWAFGRFNEKTLTGATSKRRKACSYWWFIVPASPIVAALKLLMLAIAAVGGVALTAVFWTVSAVGGWLTGYRITDGPVKVGHTLVDTIGDSRAFKVGYHKMRFTPIFVVPVAAAVVGVVALCTQADWFGAHWAWFAYPALVVLGLVVLGGGYARLVHPPLRRWFEAHCPPIEWVQEEGA